ncbi:MAG TPA: AMP-binding protein, partial [Candidatus Omnitrophota bacterium]|nr:AMP-binding protein [Candidatus Omnitrophota bacterium]
MRDEALVIHKIFAQAASDFSQKAALKIKKEGLWQKFTYRQIYEESRKAAGFLIKQEYKPGDFAALILENRPEWAIIYL